MARGATLSVLLLVFGAAVLIQFMFTTLEHFKNKKKSGKKLTGKKKSGKKKSGKKLTGKKKSGKKMSGKNKSGKKMSGKNKSGKKMSGKKRSGKKMSGKKMSGKKVSGKTVLSTASVSMTQPGKKHKDMSDVVGALTDKLHDSIAGIKPEIKNKPGVSRHCEPAPYCPGLSSNCDSDDYIKKDNIPCYGCNL